MATTYTPVIISVTLSPNPGKAGQPVRVSIAASDVQAIPANADYYSNEFYAGEV